MFQVSTTMFKTLSIFVLFSTLLTSSDAKNHHHHKHRHHVNTNINVATDPALTAASSDATVNRFQNSSTLSASVRSPEETDKTALSICRQFCECSTDNKLIECHDMQRLWSLITRGGEFEDDFSIFRVKVSDPHIEVIGLEFSLEKGSANALSKIKDLVLDDFSSLTSIHPSFFTRLLPSVERLTVSDGDNKLREVTIGYLPRLQELKVRGKNIRKVTGCDDSETYCFDPEFMKLLEVPTLTLVHMGLPDDITTVEILPNEVESAEEGDAHLFEGKTVEFLKYIMKSETNFPLLFEKITVNEEFYFELPEMENDQLELIIADVHKNPSLYARMKIKIQKSDFLFPVYYKSCPECDYDEIYASLQKSGACVEEKKYLEKFNPNLSDLQNEDITIRGIYIDIDDVIKKVKSYKTRPKNTLTVYTFIAKKPKFKTIDFHIRIFYGVLDGHSSIQQHIILPSHTSSTTFSTQEMFGTALKYAKRLDPIFVQSYSTCIAKLAADYKKNSPTRFLKNSAPWEMFMNLPNTGIYATTKDALTNSRASAIQGLLTKYMNMLAAEKHTLNKIPYTSIDVQRELAHILLTSAENILEKKRNFSSLVSLDDMKDKSPDNVKKILDSVNEAEIRLWRDEQEKAMSLATIVNKQRDLYDEELQKILDALREVKSSYEEIEKEFKAKAEFFADGAMSRHAVTWADASSELTSSLVSVINLGRFDMSQVSESKTVSGKVLRKLNSLKNVLTKILHTQKKMKRIGKIFRKIEKVYHDKFDILKADLRQIKTDQVSAKDYGSFSDLLNRFTEGVQSMDDIADGVLAVYKARKVEDHEVSTYSKDDVLFTEEINIMDPGEEISAKDIIQWENVRNKIDGLFGQHTVLEIPEAGDYKAAMFNMVTKGKAMMQLKLDECKLMADIGFADRAYWAYIEEYASLGLSVHEAHSSRKARRIDYSDEKAESEYETQYNKIEKDLYSEEFIAKLKIISAKHEFCQGYYYYHLKRCPDKYNMDIYTSLEDMIKIYRSLVLDQSIRELSSFQPAPQFFNNIAVFIRREENCQCVQGPYSTLKSVAGRTTSLKEQKLFRGESIKACFTERTKPYNDDDKNDMFDKLDRCNMDRLKRFSKENTISFDIPINFMKAFDHYERVRIEEVRVILDGIKTKSGKVVMKIENSGLLEDRYKGHVFQFLGAPWIRTYEYCSKDMRQNENEVSDEVPSVCLSRKFKTLVSTNTLENLDAFYPNPTLFSTWVISVPKADNPGLDLSELKSIQINFSGNLLMGRGNYSLYDIYGNPPKK